jgi:N-acetylglucosamine kinase-like BadF-type ATPase
VEFAIGILGHVHRSRAILVSAKEKRTETVEGGGMEWHDHFAGAPQITISQLVYDLEARFGTGIQFSKTTDLVVVAMSGIDPRYNSSRLLNILSLGGFPVSRVRVSSLAEVAHTGAFLGGPGVLLRCGSGSSVFAKSREQKTELSGGWGSVIGDHGSGAWLGKQTLVAATRVIDRIADKTERVFVEKLLSATAVKEPMDLIEKLESVRYLEGGFGVRRYLNDVGVQTAKIGEAGDPFAQLLLNRAQTLLIEATRSAISGLVDVNERLPLCLRGALIDCSEYFCTSLARRLTGEARNLSVSEDGSNGFYSPLVGLGLLALGLRSESAVKSHGAWFLEQVKDESWAKPEPSHIRL